MDSHFQLRTVLIILVLDLIMAFFIYLNIIFVQGNMIKQAEAAFMREKIHAMEQTC